MEGPLDAAETSPKRAKVDDEPKEEETSGNRVSFLTSGGAYVWRTSDIVALRNGRVAGELVGADYSLPSQNITHGSPLALSPEEIPLACEILQVPVPASHEIDTLKARVFREMHRRGYWLAKGTSFGSDYLVYPAEPKAYHACYLLVIKPWDEASSVLSYVTVARLATTVKKTAVIASLAPDGEFWFRTLKWLGT